MTPQEISSFWLNEVGPAGWYAVSAELDAEVTRRFLPAWQEATDLTSSWRDSATSMLAALILTDQFPRNMFRNDPRAFATDPLAVALAQVALEKGFDEDTPEPQRQFFYLPFMHSESLRDQEKSVELFVRRMPGDNVRHAELHRDVIEKFGRFPWRNDALDRESNKAEKALLEAGGYGALVSGTLSLDDLQRMV